MKESMPSIAQPAQAAQKLRLWLGVRSSMRARRGGDEGRYEAPFDRREIPRPGRVGTQKTRCARNDGGKKAGDSRSLGFARDDSGEGAWRLATHPRMRLLGTSAHAKSKKVTASRNDNVRRRKTTWGVFSQDVIGPQVVISRGTFRWDEGPAPASHR